MVGAAPGAADDASHAPPSAGVWVLVCWVADMCLF